MRLIEFIDIVLEAKEDKLAQQFGKKLIAAFQQEEVPPNIRSAITGEGEALIPIKIVQFLSQYDRTPQKKYLQWMLVQYGRGALRLEDAYKIPEIIKNFEKHQQRLEKRSIDQYPTYRDVDDAVRPYTAAGAEARSTSLASFLQRPEVQEALQSDGANIVYQSPRLLVVHPRDRETSCKLGRGTKWCVAATESSNYFDHYNRQGPLHFAFTDKGEKYGIHFQRGDFMNAQDYPQDPVDVVKENPEMLAAFSHEDLSRQFGRGYRDWSGRGKEAISGKDQIIRAWKELNFETDENGQMKATVDDIFTPIELEKLGFPVSPKAHMVAMEMTQSPKYKEQKRQVLDHYLYMAKGDELPDVMRLMLGHVTNRFIGTDEKEAEEYEDASIRDSEFNNEKYGTISDVYQKHGMMTQPLMQRIQNIMREKGGGYSADVLRYAPSRNSMVIRDYEDVDDANKELQLGDDLGYAKDVYEGQAEVEVGESYGEKLPTVWDDALTEDDMRDVVEELSNHWEDELRNMFEDWVKERVDFEPVYKDEEEDKTDWEAQTDLPNEEEDEEDEETTDWSKYSEPSPSELAMDQEEEPEEKREIDVDLTLEKYAGYMKKDEEGKETFSWDKNALWEVIEDDWMEKARQGFERVAHYAYLQAEESQARGTLENEAWQYLEAGPEGEYDTGGDTVPVALIQTHHPGGGMWEDPLHLHMSVPDLVRVAQMVDEDEDAEWPQFDNDDIDMETFSWDWSWDDPDPTMVRQEWNEYTYLLDEFR